MDQKKSVRHPGRRICINNRHPAAASTIPLSNTRTITIKQHHCPHYPGHNRLQHSLQLGMDENKHRTDETTNEKSKGVIGTVRDGCFICAEDTVLPPFILGV